MPANPTGRPAPGRLVRRVRALHRKNFVAAVDHEEVEQRVLTSGAFTGSYGFMVVMACGIATLGLLLSSPAVIIGAMLISPLMGPIMLFGFSLALLDFAAFRRSATALALGVALALGISCLIVLLSPLSQATPEILGRTRPNLFDLLVAVFSGLAGAYAVVTKKGETIVGVAIATALMPPLCVVGYGLAKGAFEIAGGALFLFMTNLLAIALSATALAGLYGFAARQSRRDSAWRAVLIVVVFVALSIPLGISLNRIATEARVSVLVRDTLESALAGESRLGELGIRFGDDAVKIDAVALTKRYESGAEARLQTALTERLGQPVILNLDQVLVDQDQRLDPSEFLRLAETSLAAPLQAQIAQLTRRDQLRQDFRNTAPFRVGALEVETQLRTATMYAAPSRHLDLSAYREIEREMSSRHPNWKLTVVPPPQPLPPVPFEIGSAELTNGAREVLETIFWTLARWQVDRVSATGYASSVGPRRLNRALAIARADAVADYLRAQGIDATASGEFRRGGQDKVERMFGLNRFHRVDVSLVTGVRTSTTARSASREARSPVPGASEPSPVRLGATSSTAGASNSRTATDAPASIRSATTSTAPRPTPRAAPSDPGE